MRDYSNDIDDLIKKCCYSILKANISKNTYQIIWKGSFCKNKETRAGNLRRLCDKYLNKDIIYDEDLVDFLEYVNLDFISAFLRKYNGKENYLIEIRRKIKGEYKPISLEFVPACDYSNDDQNVYIVVKMAGNKLKEDYVRLSDLLLGLSENFGAIYYVDFDKDIVCPFRMHEVIEREFGKTLRANPSYEAAMDAYIDKIIIERDREEMRKVTRYEFLKEQLKNVRSYTHEYNVERNGRIITFRFKIANLDGVGELHRAVLGFADVSSEKTCDYNMNSAGKTILIVESDTIHRQDLRDILSLKYKVLAVDNEEELLNILNEGSEEISLVITDLFLAEKDGYLFIRELKKSRKYSRVPLIVAADANVFSSKDESQVRKECFKQGAIDFVMKPFDADILLNRIDRIIQLKESTSLLSHLEKDSLTGLYSREFFFGRVEKYLQEHGDEDLVMWVSDIIGLKIINEKYGFEMGDSIIECQADNIESVKGVIIAGRIEGDKFGALIYNKNLDELKALASKPDMGVNFPLGNVIVKNGFYHIRKRSSLPSRGMFDRALIALQKIKDNYDVYWSEYDDEIRRDLLNKRLILESGPKALKEQQFTVYYQPKYDIQNNITCGAEALIRWEHPELGFMNPGVFIPLFEQNGFIKELDYYVWDIVCQTIRSWLDKGKRIVPISVNFSRRDFDDVNLARKVIDLVDSYGIEHKFFHIEITESAYSDNPQLIKETIKVFHDNGFIVELDDFGSGYSSMSALSELDLDVMKIDVSIINSDDAYSGKSILEFSMQLAKMMKLKTVAEGVETLEQVNRILSLGGDYIQGYYYSKPLPREMFEEYLKNE